MPETIALTIAYLLYVGSGFIRTVINLRIALVAASLAFIVWSIMIGVWAAVFWNVAFATVHGFQLIRLWRRQRSIKLSRIQAAAHNRLFSDLDLLDFYTLWSIGASIVIEEGLRLITEGEPQATVMLIISGTVEIERGGAAVATLGPDSVIGERSYLTGDPANASAIAGENLVIHQWNQDDMKALAKLCPAAHDSMVRHISQDLATKLW